MIPLSILRRRDNVDDVSDVSSRQMGMSFATSWASGPSVFLSVIFMQNYGIIPGTAWMICNVLTLVLVGAFASYVPLSRRWVEVSILTLPLFALYIAMEVLITLVNLSAIKGVFDGQGAVSRISVLSLMSPTVATYVAVAIGVAIVVLIHVYGFRGSVISDRWQYAVQITAAATLAFLTYMTFEERKPPLEYFVPASPGKIGGEEWFFLGVAGIISGAFAYAQMWERLAAVPQKDAIKVGSWGALYFGMYMVFIWIMAYYLTKTVTSSWIVIVIILTIATSTIDSAVAGLQYLAKKVGFSPVAGTVIALGTMLSFPYTIRDIDTYWNLMANIRWRIIAAAVVVTIALQLFFWLRKHTTSAETKML